MSAFNKLERMRTLLVDADQSVRDSFSLVFKNCSCFLQVAETAEEGLKLLEREHFDIIISDLELRGVNGIEFFKLTATSHPNSLKVLISATIDDNTKLGASAAGVHTYIQKPYVVQTLIETLNSLL